MKKILFGLIACAAMCACSDDVVMDTSSTPQIALDGNDVYLTIRLNDVGSATRATSSGFQNGSAAEYDVTDAYFYFYDEDGLFVSRADVWDGGNATNNGDGNVEFQSNTVVVLKGLTDNRFPRYMVTVLNEPSGFEGSYYEPAATLDDFQAKLANAENVLYNNYGNFVMSTSAYATPVYTGQYATDGESDLSPWYFVTPINEDDFKEEPVNDLTHDYAVQVYVERLAAKVEVDLSETLTTEITVTDDEGTHYLYDTEETVAGLANDEYTGTVDDGETYEEGVDHVYVELLGWALNGTARNSNIVKDITPFVSAGAAQTIDDSWLATDWNDASNFRSYWGASYNYGIEAAYPTTNVNPTTGAANTDSEEEDASTWLNPYLKYTSLVDDNLLQFVTDAQTGSVNYDYCAENTNTTDVLGDNKNSSAITNALIKARAWINTGTAETPNYVVENIVRFEGELFTEDYFLTYIESRVSADVLLYGNLYYASVSGITSQFDEYTAYTMAQLEEDGVTSLTAASSTEDWLKLESNPYGNDSIYVELDDDAVNATINDNGYVWFELRVAAEAAADGSYAAGDTIYYAINMMDETTLAGFEAAVRAALDEYNTIYEMIGYQNGLMYYAIPIEHLNATTPPDGAPNNLYEGNYGIVRNHWYQITVNSISSVGKGIWDEEQVIIPDLNPTYYYVDADINILSWKMVEQQVDL